MAPTATIPIDPAPWMEIITIGGPATAIIVVLGLMTIAVFRYAINPGLASYAKIAGEHRESAVEARVAATNSRDAAEASKLAATKAKEAAEASLSIIGRISK